MLLMRNNKLLGEWNARAELAQMIAEKYHTHIFCW
jgi:hypothetical protein